MLNAIWFVLSGMGVVFAALALLMLAMFILNRFPGKPESKPEGGTGG